MKKYTGEYTNGSNAGLTNNLNGASAEELLDSTLQKLDLIKDKDYLTQQRVPYFSEEKFRKISSSYAFFHDNTKLKNKSIDELLNKFIWNHGGPNINEDFVIASDNSVENIKTIISVTQASPTKRGHSIENKLHQALGELYLHKVHNPNVRSLLFVGGKEEGWSTDAQYKKYQCSYVLSTLKLFYDDVIFSWEGNIEQQLTDALNCELKNQMFWTKEKQFADQVKLSDETKNIPKENLRRDFIANVWEPITKQKITSLKDIKNDMARLMSKCSQNAKGASKDKFYNKVVNGELDKITIDRGFNNPPEAAISLLLDAAKLDNKAELINGKANVKTGNNLLYLLGFMDMHRYTDFILTAKDGKKVYVESKSSGGGFEGGHKHITDRAREQIARSLLHRTTIQGNELISNEQDYHWIFVLDADWCTPEIYPNKYIHTLQLAGVRAWFSASSLVDANYNIDHDCEFINYMKKLCHKGFSR